MLIFKFFFLFFKFFFLFFKFFFRYCSIILVQFFYFFLFFPSLCFSFFKNFVFFFFKLFWNNLKKFFSFCLLKFNKFIKFYLLEPFYQFVHHFCFLKLVKEKIFRRFYFYRRSYYVSGRSFKLLIKAVWTVELNALLIKRSIQPFKPLLLKAWNLPFSRTLIGRRFRIFRRLIKFFVGIISLFYPIQMILKFGLWYITGYLVKLLKFLEYKNFIKRKYLIKFLKFIVWLKLFFIWSEIPFILLFKPGVSKKYPQFEDMQPDTRVINAKTWDFALLRDCYFDEDDVLNAYYIFHKVRGVSNFFFNAIIFNFVLVYLMLLNFLYILQFIYFLTYIPLKFVNVYVIFSGFILSLKLSFVFLYLIPVFCLFSFFLIIYLTYTFLLKKFTFFYSQKYFINFYFFNFYKIFISSFIKNFTDRLFLFLYYFVFKFKSLNYFIFKTVEHFITIDKLFKLNVKFKSLLSSLFLSNKSYNSLFYYNTSYVFKRVRPYLIKLNNVQFLWCFHKFHKTSRITPDQLKAFLKVGLNSRYPLDYFEKLFDIEYSKMELEYELPYYWAFVRQSHSVNDGFLHPKFHVYGFFNFIKFYWNYFSFLNATNTFEFESVYAHEFMQLFNSSAAQFLGLLTNDFVKLIKIKNFRIKGGYFKLTMILSSTQWYLFHTKYYDKWLRFFWDYYDGFFIKFLYYYYSIFASPLSLKIYSFFNLYSEKVRHSIGWYTFSFYERIAGKVFLSINKFEDYYDINFDKSLDRYNLYIKYLKYFFGSTPISSKIHQSKSSSTDPNEISDNTKNSVRFLEYEQKLAAQRKKDYNETMSDFFIGSFSFFGQFYTFVRDNVFEFITVLYSVWRDYIDTSINNWSKSRKIFVFLFYFSKALLYMWLFVIVVALFFCLFFIKSLLIIIIKKMKKIYV